MASGQHQVLPETYILYGSEVSERASSIVSRTETEGYRAFHNISAR